MLVVCLLGAFPFDHSQAAVPGTTEDEVNLWCALSTRAAGLWCCSSRAVADSQVGAKTLPA